MGREDRDPARFNFNPDAGTSSGVRSSRLREGKRLDRAAPVALSLKTPARLSIDREQRMNQGRFRRVIFRAFPRA
jgi:hypothetical protein